MTRLQQIEHAYDELLTCDPAGERCLQLSITDGAMQGTLSASFDDFQPIGCECRCLNFFGPTTAAIDGTDLPHLASRLGERIRYLLEPLGMCEVDQESARMVVRSDPPERRDDRTVRYFELFVCPERGITLERYESRPKQTRRPIASVLTRELFCRLAYDLTVVIENHD